MKQKAETTKAASWGLIPFLGLLLLAPAGCGDTSTSGDAGDTGTDETPGDQTELDTPDGDVQPHDPLPDAEDTTDEDGPPPPEGDREILASSLNRACIGCDSVSWCGRPPLSDITALTFDCAPNNDTGHFFAAERWEWHGRVLDLDTCRTFTGDDMDSILDAIEGVTVLDAGPISWSGDMEALTPPLMNDYSDLTHNYPSLALIGVNLDPDLEYIPGVDMTVESPGGDDVSAFSASAVAVETIDIISPSTDGSGQIQNIATDAPLEVTWSGGSDYDDVVIMLYFAVCPDMPSAFVMCRAANDGAFTIPLENLAGLEWPNIVLLYMSQSLKIPIDAAELTGDPAWSVRSHSMVPVYHDPDFTPPPFECDATSMPEGFVGNPCTDDSDCGGGCCLEAVDVYYYDNYCTLDDCDSDAECPADSLCTRNVHPVVQVDHFCAKRCSDDSECRTPEYACLYTDEGETVCRPNFW